MTATRKKTTRARKKPSSGPRPLLWASVCLLCGYFMVLLVKVSNTSLLLPGWLLPGAIFVLPAALTFFLLQAGGYRGDKAMPACAFLLGGLGVIARFRLGAAQTSLPLAAGDLAIPAGFLLMLLVWFFFRRQRLSWLEHTGLAGYFIAMALLGSVIVFGQRFRGALFLPGNINPSDLARVGILLFLADFLTLHHKELKRTSVGFPTPPASTVFTFCTFWLILMGVLIFQRDLGVIILLNTILLLLLFVSTERWGYLFSGGLLIVAACTAIFYLAAHGQTRFLIWMNPYQDPTGAGWQILQSLSALYTGGLWGAGLGAGFPSDVPIASSDFIYSAIGEELGFLGCALILLTYFVFFRRGLLTACQAKSPFARHLAYALTLSLGLQTLLNVGGVTKALPLTGITLPFISAGGTSLLASFLSLGLLMAVSDAPMPRPRRRKSATSADNRTKKKA